MEYMRSHTEYSYHDPDNVVLPKARGSRESSTDSSSSGSERNGNYSREYERKPRKNSKYNKLKKELKNTKSSLSKTKNMLELQKVKNETQEEKLKTLAMEVENIKRTSLETFLTNKSVQSFALNPGLFNINQQLENFAYATQRTTPEVVIKFRLTVL